ASNSVHRRTLGPEQLGAFFYFRNTFLHSPCFSGSWYPLASSQLHEDRTMKKTLLILTLCALIACSAHPEQPAQNHFDGKTWWDYVKVLADDNMEGRETGSAGLRKAEAYVVELLKKDGLEPAGVNGFYQPIKFESRQIIEKDSSLALVQNGK